MAAQSNPLIDESLVDFLLYSVLDAESLCELDAYQQHSKETFDMFIDSVRRFARQDLLPTYKPMDENPPEFRDGRIHTHPALPALYEAMIELGVLTATRPESVGGQQIPMLVHTMASAYLMAANLGAYGFVGLTHGAAHLIEAFGSAELKERFMTKMYDGQWTGTMALTEPHAGSSLGDITTSATPTDDGHYLIKGSKIFISGADHQLADNIVNLTLARIDGAPDGTKGISLFAIPRLREQNGELVPNDVTVAGLIHKIGWKGLPSLALEFGDEGDCRGWLVGEPHQGLRYMFQMMNEARIMVGVNATATASAAYHESLSYARDRKQGRNLGARGGEMVPIIEHADVRRMLLRQKAIVEGSLALLGTVSRYAARVADELGIPHYVFDVEEDFTRDVIDDFVDEYAQGRTPNPCVRCNSNTKFRDLMRRGKALGCTAIASGHYVRSVRPAGHEPELHRGADSNKDQAYFLWGLPPELLPQLRFPLGALDKAGVREAARLRDFVTADKPESQEICFVPSGSYRDLLERRLPTAHPALMAGDLVRLDGTHIGEHAGYAGFTVGQRRGFGGGHSEPLYVLGIRPESREVVVGSYDELFSPTVTIGDLNWLTVDPPEEGAHVQVRIRHRAPDVPATVTSSDAGVLTLRFDEPQRAVTPGQSGAVFSGSRLLGGGRIR